MAQFTTTELLASIKRRAMLPDTGGIFSDSELLAMASEEMDATIVPLVISAREEYYVVSQDITVVANQQAYRIPERAIGGKLRDLTFLSTSTPQTGVSMPRLPLETVDAFAGSGYSPAWGPGFVLQRNQFLLVPTPTAGATGTVRVRFYRRPGRLVTTTAAGVYQSNGFTYGLGGKIFGVVPASITTSTPIDLIQGKSQFDWLMTDITPSLVSVGVSVTVGAGDTVPTDAVSGDWVAFAGESPIPQIPVEFHEALAQATAVKLMEAMGDRAAMQVAQAKLQESLNNAMMLITPRVDGECEKIVNRTGALRSPARWGWRLP